MKIDIERDLNALPSQKFIPLGTIAKNLESWSDLLYQKKIDRKLSDPVEGVWGTLGWKDDSVFSPKGEIEFSSEGNLDEGRPESGRVYSLTEQEINDLKMINPELGFGDHEVRERYLNFDNVDFELPEVFNPVELPCLRLTLFLQPNEGALVYYQHSKKEDKNDPDAVFEYILYKKKQAPSRERLDYCFPVEPKHKLVAVDKEKHLYRESDEETGLSFIVKILTFRQKRAPEQEIYNGSVEELNKVMSNNLVYELVGKDKYDLLFFDANSAKKPGGKFVSIKNRNQVNPDGKTLLLIHGTFVDTDSSFGDLMLRKGTKDSYLQELLNTGKFDQILALNHPTISHDAHQNVEWLNLRLASLDLTLSQPLQILTSSRGALVAEYMASDEGTNRRIGKISKIMMYSAGNGSGYFKLGNKISTVLTIWKNTVSGPGGKIILGIAQLSVEWFLEQPGCKLMNENHTILGDILSKKPQNPDIQYKTVVSDWHNCLVADEKWMKRIGQTSLDVLIRIALGEQHDWVIGCEQQRKIPAGSKAPEVTELHCIHGRYMELNFVKDKQCAHIPDPHYMIGSFFD